LHPLVLLFIIFIAIQIIYLIAFIVVFSKKSTAENNVSVPVSVIVCAHDEEQNLRELIPLLLKQDYGEFEIIVVEDRSNDESFDYLYEACKQHAQLRMVPVKSKPDHVNGKKFALTLGIKAAKHEWVLLTDADCRPNGNLWIKEMSRHFSSEKSIVLGYSPYLKTSGFLNLFIRFEGLLTAMQYMGMALFGRPYMGVGRNLAYRKKLFLDNKGFNSHLSVTGGDDDLFINEVSTKMNTVVCLGSDSVVFSKPKTSWSDYYIQKVRHLSVGRHYNWSDKLILGTFSMSMIGSWLLFAPAVVFSSFLYVPVLAFSLRMILITVLIRTASLRLGDTFAAWKTPFLDFIFVIYYLVIGPVALYTNKIRWKKT